MLPRIATIVSLATLTPACYSVGKPNHQGDSQCVDPRAYGAVPNDGADDTSALQAAVDAAGINGAVVILPHGVLELSATVEITSPVTILGAGAGISILKRTGSGGNTIEIRSSHVSIADVTIWGPSSDDVFVPGEVGIYATGSSSANYLLSIRLTGLEVMNYGDGGIRLCYVSESRVSENSIRRIGYSAIEFLSCSQVLVDKNYVRSVKPGEYIEKNIYNAYGITFSHHGGTPSLEHPASEFCIASGNVVIDVPAWSALDTHDGSFITFSNNVAEGCAIGIHAGGGAGGAYTMRNIVITGNSLSAGAARHHHYGIAVGGTETHYATGIVIANNVVNGYGIPERQGKDDDSGAIRVQRTGSMSITGNVVEDFAEVGIQFVTQNTNMLCSGNTISTGTPANAKSIEVRDLLTYGYIIGNRSNGFGRSLPTGTHVNLGPNDL